jgi:ABC-type multidrug transport system fused ATPase/permease subunit
MIENLKKIYAILNIEQKKSLVQLSFLIIFSIFFEILSLALIIPLTYVVLNDPYTGIERITTFFGYSKYSYVYLYFENMNKQILINLIICIFFFTFLFKNLYLLFQYYFSSTLIAKINVQLSNKTIKYFLNSNYLDLQKYKLPVFFSTLIHEISVFTNGVLFSLVIIITESLVLLAIILIVVKISGVKIIFGIAGFLFLFYVLFYFTKKKINQLGKNRQIYSAKKIEIIEALIKSIKDIKFYNLEKKFINLYTTIESLFSNFEKKNNIIISIPRLALETIIIILICFFLIVLNFYNLLSSESIVVVALYTTLGIRLLPSLNKIIINYQNFLYARASIDTIYLQRKKLIKEKKLSTSKQFVSSIEKIKFKKNIEIKNLYFSYGNKLILNGINLKAKKGEIIGIMGDSGSGKTTLVDILSGLIKPKKYHLLIDGNQIDDIAKIRELIGYAQQNPIILPGNLKENIAFGIDSKKINMDTLNSIIDICYLNSLKKDKVKISSIVTNISGGQKQRISIARALYFNPKILILDEATSGLDEQLEKKMLINIRKKFKSLTIFVVSHNARTLQICNKIYELKRKKLLLKKFINKNSA